jgi:CheY-like chemotaxis protein
LASSSVCTPLKNIPGPAWGLPFASELSLNTMARSGSTPNSDEDQPSASPSPRSQPTTGRLHILVAEDNPADIFLIRAAIDLAGIQAEIDIARDGEQATRFCDAADENASAPHPSMVILDINLPKKRGIEVLEHLRRSRRCGSAAVIVVSSSSVAKDRDAVMQGGAQAYFRKASEYDEFLKLADLIREWFPKEGAKDS